MYPYKLIRFPDGSGITLYEIFILIGVIAAIVLFRILADRRKMPAKLQNLVLIGAVVSFIVGYLCAVLFQAVYNAIATGEFSLGSGTGSTFYGGFIGGAVCMLLIYFVGGRILFGQKGEHIGWFHVFANIAAACIPFAHAFGRIGCLTAGCCHGGITDAWYGITQYIETEPGKYGWEKVVPVQLFEAIFLFALAAVLIVLVWKGKGFELPAYLAGYGVWRFIIEFFRTDDRGASFIPFLSPSQTTAVLLIAIAAALFLAAFILRKKGRQPFPPFSRLAENNSGKSEIE